MQTLARLGTGRVMALVGSTIALAAVLIFLATRYTSPTMSLLYANLDPKDSGEITAKLDAMAVPYTVRPDGTAIMVPADQVGRLRVAMASNGLPHGGSVGFELFDKPEGLGTTDFVQNINEMRALEGELERTIGAIDAIDSSRVHLVLPKRELFSRDVQQPSASIMVKVRGGQELGKSQIAAIQNLVASAVPGLKAFRVTIVDQNGTLLARATDDPAQSLDITNDTDDARVSYETRLSHSIEDMLEQSLGPGRARVEVSADMDFDRVTTASEVYDPNGQVVRSTETVSETNQNSEANDTQPVTVQTNLPEGQQTNAGSGSNSGSQSKRSQETTNYEISKNVTTQTRQAGIVKRLSVAVLVDGIYATDKDGKTSYQPRSDAEIKQISDLVKTASGYNDKRGDQIKVVNLRFVAAESGAVEDKPIILGLTKSDLISLFEKLLWLIAAILIGLLVVRPLLIRAIEAAREAAAGGGGGMVGAGGGALPPPGSMGALPGPGGSHALMMAGGEEEDDSMIDIGMVEGRVKASSMKKIGEIVDKHPDEAVAIIRSWMYQGS